MPETDDNDDNFGPILDGITLPDTIILPPEIIPLLPWMGMAELKVTLAAIARMMQVGGAEPITLSEFQQITGLARASVQEGIERALKRGLLIRYEVSGYQGHTSYVYELKPRFIGSNFEPMLPIKAKLSQAVVVNNISTTNLSLANGSEQNDAKTQQKQALFERLRKIGVYAKTAKKLLQEHDVQRIERFLALYPLAQRVGRAEGPGWLVKAIIDLSWDPDTEQADLESRLARQQENQEDQVPPPPAVETVETVEQPALPQRISRQLQEIGWVGDTQEIYDAWSANKRRVTAWLKWAVKQDEQHRAARFRVGLRSGGWPPVQRNDDPHRFITGKFGEYVEH